MAEGAPLLREYTVMSCIKGSNPFVSASKQATHGWLFCCRFFSMFPGCRLHRCRGARGAIGLAGARIFRIAGTLRAQIVGAAVPTQSCLIAYKDPRFQLTAFEASSAYIQCWRSLGVKG